MIRRICQTKSSSLNRMIADGDQGAGAWVITLTTKSFASTSKSTSAKVYGSYPTTRLTKASLVPWRLCAFLRVDQFPNLCFNAASTSTPTWTQCVALCSLFCSSHPKIHTPSTTQRKSWRLRTPPKTRTPSPPTASLSKWVSWTSLLSLVNESLASLILRWGETTNLRYRFSQKKSENKSEKDSQP